MKSPWILIAAFSAASSAALAQSNLQRPEFTKSIDEWRAAHGDGWRYDVDEGTGYLEMLYGWHLEPAFVPSNDAEWFTLARQVLADTQAMHGLAGRTLVEDSSLFLPLGMVGSSDKMTVRFRQVVAGVPVDMGSVNVLFDAAGTLLSIQEHALPLPADFDVQPAITAQTATQDAASIFVGEHFKGRVPTAIDDPQLVIAQVDRGGARVPVLAWRVGVYSEDAALGAVGRTYWIDAKAGGVAKTEEAIHNFDVGGTVSTKAVVDHYPDEAGHPATQQVAKYMRLTSSAGTVTTDINGNFNYPGVNGPLSITCTYDGTFNDVTNQAGANYSLVFSAATGSGNAIVLNNVPSAQVTAQSNIFWGINTQRDWVRSINPLDTHADFVSTANVNINSSCNAYYTSQSGGSINFYLAGTTNNCANTAYPNVAYHENGHWLNVKYATGNGGDGMGEGNGDVWAMYIDDDPITGHDFCGVGCNVRNGLNTRQFCGDANGGCYGETHADGEVWMGAAWKVRRNLKTTLGNPAGIAKSNSLFLGWMNAYDQTQIKSIIETQWLTLDDNNGNLADGTPDFHDINNGFVEQGFPIFLLSNLVTPGVTTNQSGPYTISATIAPKQAFTPITGVTMRWRAGSSGSFASNAMTQGAGNVWSSTIPGPITAPKKVYFYFQITDSVGHLQLHPTAAPTDKLYFSIGVPGAPVCNNFETDQGWTVANSNLSTGAWERGDPIGTTNSGAQAQPDVDNPSGTGTLCYFTGQGVAGGAAGDNDVDGGPTVLTSPVFDMSGGEGEIAYAYWMYNSGGDDSLVVQVSNNGSTWVTAKSYKGGGGGWLNGSIDVGTWIQPNATTRVRFSISDNPSNTITEGAIDDVCVAKLGPVVCPSASTYCTAKTNSQGCVPAIASSGTASASSASPFDISVSQVLNNKNILLFYGAGSNSAPFQGGTLCVLPPLRRTPLNNSGGNAGPDDCSGTMTFNFNTQIQTSGDPILISGATINAQYYYRDPADALTVGLSNGVQFQICP